MRDLRALSLKLVDGQLLILDQQMLPDNEVWIGVENPDHMIQIIKDLKVRGAPLIGVAAGLSLALWSQKKPKLPAFLQEAEKLREARPTAVNLMYAIDRLIEIAESSDANPEAILQTAFAIYDEDVNLCEKMALRGATLISDGDHILTHCNTGGLATVGVGTALGAIIRAHDSGKQIHVYVDETRPLLQGGRLTTYELEKAKVPYTLICDNMAATLMKQSKVHKVFVGADRIAANGDFANKIGTYSLAVLADFHKVPFYILAPQTTVDIHCPNGDGILIEERKGSEVRGVFTREGEIRWAPEAAPVFNPAFDVTPGKLVTGMVIDDQLFSRGQLMDHQLAKFL